MTRETAELHELRRARKRVPFPIPESACRVIGAFGMNDPMTIGRVTFRLKTTKKGTEIWFNAPTGPAMLFNWNVSAMLDIWPPSFKQARQWVAAYAAGYGQTVEEIRKDQIKRPAGGDRKLLKAGGCREAWLTSDVPQLFAEAMIRCQHPGGFCSSDGYCHYGNCNMEMLPETVTEEID